MIGIDAQLKQMNELIPTISSLAWHSLGFMSNFDDLAAASSLRKIQTTAFQENDENIQLSVSPIELLYKNSIVSPLMGNPENCI